MIPLGLYGAALRQYSISYEGDSGPPIVYGNQVAMTLNWPADCAPGDYVLLITGNRQAPDTVTADNGFSQLATVRGMVDATRSRATALGKIIDTPPSGIITVTKTGVSNTQAGLAFRFAKSGGSWDVATYTAINDTLVVTDIDLDFGDVDVRKGDFVVVHAAGTTYGSPPSDRGTGLVIPGVTLGGMVHEGYVSSSSGSDTMIPDRIYPVLAGQSSGPAVLDARVNIGTRSSTYAGILTRLRAA